MFDFRIFGKEKTITPAQAKDRLAAGGAVRLIDVRTPAEFTQGHIPTSISLPLDQIKRIAQITPDKNAPVIVYCQSGARASAACRQLTAMGYTDVSNLGGIVSWPYGIVRGA